MVLYSFSQKMDRATFWATFSQAHLVTLNMITIFSAIFANFRRKNWRFLKKQCYDHFFSKNLQSSEQTVVLTIGADL
jgi:hypothetical protein